MNDLRNAAREADKPKHMPGPWKAITRRDWYWDDISGPNAEQIGECNRINPGDTALICAAPDLLEACKAMLRYLTHYQGGEIGMEMRFTALELAEKAVAKAEGRQ